MRGKDKQPRRRRTRAEMTEFMPSRGVSANRMNLPTYPIGEEPETPEPQTLKMFARSILDDEVYRASLKARAQNGKLTPAEARLLVALGTEAAEVKRMPLSEVEMRAMIACMSPQEIRICADAAMIQIRAKARAKGYQLPGDPARKVERMNLAGQLIAEWQQ